MSWTGEGGQGRRYVHITETPDVRHITNPDVMHEESDVNVKGVGAFVAILFTGLVVMSVMMIGLWKVFEWRARVADERIAVTPMARTQAERLPPAPRLQAAPGFQSLDDPKMSFELKEPAAEWNALREKWDYELHNPTAADPNTQTRRVPIEDAKRMLLEKGLPARDVDFGNVDLGTMFQPKPTGTMVVLIPDVPSYSSAGRQTQKREVWAGTGTLNTLPEKQQSNQSGGESNTKH